MPGTAGLLDQPDRLLCRTLVDVGHRDRRALASREHRNRPAVAHRRIRVVGAPGATTDNEQPPAGQTAAHAVASRGACRGLLVPSGQPGVSGSSATPTLLSRPDTKR